MPQLCIILGIYSLITMVSVLTFMAYFNVNKKEIIKHNVLRTQLRRQVRTDLINTIKPLSLISNKGNNQLWLNAAHRLDIHSQLDQEIIHHGEYIITQLYNWAAIKQLIDSNEISISYTTTFATSKISPEASILLSTLASFYFRSINDGEELNLSIALENNKVTTKFKISEGKRLPNLTNRIKQFIKEKKGKINQSKNLMIISFNH